LIFLIFQQYFTLFKADNRKIRRLMEQENKKERDKKKRAYNEHIRVSFIFCSINEIENTH